MRAPCGISAGAGTPALRVPNYANTSATSTVSRRPTSARCIRIQRAARAAEVAQSVQKARVALSLLLYGVGQLLGLQQVAQAGQLALEPAAGSQPLPSCM